MSRIARHCAVCSNSIAQLAIPSLLCGSLLFSPAVPLYKPSIDMLNSLHSRSNVQVQPSERLALLFVRSSYASLISHAARLSRSRHAGAHNTPWRARILLSSKTSWRKFQRKRDEWLLPPSMDVLRLSAMPLPRNIPSPPRPTTMISLHPAGCATSIPTADCGVGSLPED